MSYIQPVSALGIVFTGAGHGRFQEKPWKRPIFRWNIYPPLDLSIKNFPVKSSDSLAAAAQKPVRHAKKNTWRSFFPFRLVSDEALPDAFVRFTLNLLYAYIIVIYSILYV